MRQPYNRRRPAIVSVAHLQGLDSWLHSRFHLHDYDPHSKVLGQPTVPTVACRHESGEGLRDSRERFCSGIRRLQTAVLR